MTMPGFGLGTLHHLKDQQLTLELFTTKCAWLPLPFPQSLWGTHLIQTTNMIQVLLKPTERVPLGFSGGRWMLCVPMLPLLVQYLEPQSCSFCLSLPVLVPNL